MAVTDFIGIFLIWAFVTVMVLTPTSVAYIRSRWADIKAAIKAGKESTGKNIRNLSLKSVVLNARRSMKIATGETKISYRMVSPHLLRKKRQAAMKNATKEMAGLLPEGVDIDDENAMLREVIRKLAVLEKDVYVGFQRMKPPPLRALAADVQRQGDSTGGVGVEEGEDEVLSMPVVARVNARVAAGEWVADTEEEKSTRTTNAGFAFPVGTRVVHPAKGWGVVTENMPDGRTRVKFDYGVEHRYKPAAMLKFEGAGDPGPAQQAEPPLSPDMQPHRC